MARLFQTRNRKSSNRKGDSSSSSSSSSSSTAGRTNNGFHRGKNCSSKNSTQRNRKSNNSTFCSLHNILMIIGSALVTYSCYLYIMENNWGPSLYDLGSFGDKGSSNINFVSGNSQSITNKDKSQTLMYSPQQEIRNHPRVVKLIDPDDAGVGDIIFFYNTTKVKFVMNDLIYQRKRIINKYNALFVYQRDELSATRSSKTYSKAIPPWKPVGCTALGEWQEAHYPTCNIIHEINLRPHIMEQSIENDKNNKQNDNDDDGIEMTTKILTGGAFRHVWSFLHNDAKKFVIKTLRVDSKRKTFDVKAWDRHRRDSVSYSELTHSPLIMDLYGFCTNSAIFDYSPDGDLSSIFGPSRSESEDSDEYEKRKIDVPNEQLFQIAYNISLALHHAHHVDAKGRASIAHTDIKPDQFIMDNGYYKLTDFNRVRFLSWDEKKQQTCPFEIAKNGGIWRSPEEYSYEPETEKVDVYSLGNVLYFLYMREVPWWSVTSSRDEVYERVMNGERPPLPDLNEQTDSIYDKYMKLAIKGCYTHNPTERPSAKEISDILKKGLDELHQQQ